MEDGHRTQVAGALVGGLFDGLAETGLTDRDLHHMHLGMENVFAQFNAYYPLHT
jgi:hypothetical protein